MSTGSNIAKGVLAGLGIFVAYKAGAAIYDKFETSKGVGIETDPKNTIKKGFTIAGKPIGASGANLTTIAGDLYNSINVPWYSKVDQDRAVRVFMSIPFGQVTNLQKLYLQLYSQDLKKRLAEQLDDLHFIKIKYYF